METRIEKLNQFASVKMANINSKKRPAAKEAKELAKYIIENWDNEFELAKIQAENVHNEEILEILRSRLTDFAEAKKACEEAVKKAEEPKKEVKLTDKEQMALEFFVKASESGEGFIMEDVATTASDIANISPKSLKGLSSSLQKKGLLDMYNGGAYYDGQVTELGWETYSSLVAKATAEAKKKVEKVEKTKKTTGHKVGDLHKNGKWVWTEYKPGKFDWRTIPSENKQGQRTDIAKKDGEKKTATKAAKSNAKQPKKSGEKKTAEKKKEAPKMLTIDEFRAMPKQSRSGKKMSKAQEEALKLIMKGYWIEVKVGPLGAEYASFVNSEGDRKQCYMDSVEALFRRYGINYIPEGLVK